EEGLAGGGGFGRLFGELGLKRQGHRQPDQKDKQAAHLDPLPDYLATGTNTGWAGEKLPSSRGNSTTCRTPALRAYLRTVASTANWRPERVSTRPRATSS